MSDGGFQTPPIQAAIQTLADAAFLLKDIDRLGEEDRDTIAKKIRLLIDQVGVIDETPIPYTLTDEILEEGQAGLPEDDPW